MNARDAALKTLVRIYDGQAFSNLEIKKALKQDKINDNEKNLYIKLVYGTLQWQYTIDKILQRYIDRDFDKLKPELKAIFSLAVYQLLFLDNHPAYAVINEAVKQTKKWAKNRSGFVNGVLRNIERNKEEILSNLKKSKDLSFRTSVEPWILRKYQQDRFENIAGLLENINEPAPVTVRVKPENYIEVFDELVRAGAEPKAVDDYKNYPLSKEAIIIQKPSNVKGDLTSLESYKNGLMTIQNIGSIIISEALEPQENDMVIDMCAAPGGKSAHIADLMHQKGNVIACDIYPKRLELIKNNAERLDSNIIKPFLSDGTKNIPEFKEKFDRILVDAPCSGLGMIRRKPDIRINANEEGIKELNKTQEAILENAFEYVKPGGRIVYSTCTVGKEENQNIVNNLIEKHPEQLQLITDENLYNISDSGDAFYYAVIEKIKS